jgi:hypothetical protein
VDAILVLDLERIRERAADAREARLEDARVVDPLHALGQHGRVVRHQGDGGRLRAEGADDEGAALLVRAEDRVRVLVGARRDPLNFVPGCRGHRELLAGGLAPPFVR